MIIHHMPPHSTSGVTSCGMSGDIYETILEVTDILKDVTCQGCLETLHALLPERYKTAKDRVLEKLRRVLGVDHLDAVHLDILNILTSPDFKELMLEALAEAEAQDEQYLRPQAGEIRRS